MNIQETVLNNLNDLSFDKQKIVLEFIKFLKYQQETELGARFDLKGLWADFNFSIDEHDIAKARQEMWGNCAEEIASTIGGLIRKKS
jgi:hypothetical protein